MTSLNSKISIADGQNVQFPIVDESQHFKTMDIVKELDLPVSTLKMLVFKCKIIEETPHLDVML